MQPGDAAAAPVVAASYPWHPRSRVRATVHLPCPPARTWREQMTAAEWPQGEIDDVAHSLAAGWLAPVFIDELVVAFYTDTGSRLRLFRSPIPCESNTRRVNELTAHLPESVPTDLRPDLPTSAELRAGNATGAGAGR